MAFITLIKCFNPSLLCLFDITILPYSNIVNSNFLLFFIAESDIRTACDIYDVQVFRLNYGLRFLDQKLVRDDRLEVLEEIFENG